MAVLAWPVVLLMSALVPSAVLLLALPPSRWREDRLGRNQRKQSGHYCNECFVPDRAGIFTTRRSLQDTLRSDLFLSLVWGGACPR
jgi:hypothetical protein